MTEDETKVAILVQDAFNGVTLGEGVGLREAQGLDDYADSQTLAEYRSQDEKNDWSKISTTDLDRYNSSLSFFDAEGMRFHVPAYLIAELMGHLGHDLKFHLCMGFHRFEKLSDSQRNAVREYLQLCLSDPNCDFERPMIEEALRVYWMVSKRS